jgi:hypothetical protein
MQSLAKYLNPESSFPVRATEYLPFIRTALQYRNLRRVLLVLDGLDTLQQSEQPGSSGSCLQDESILTLLGLIARKEAPVCAVVITREMPVEIEERGGNGYFHVRLKGLPEKAASNLLRSCAQTGSAAQLAELAGKFNYHPMTLYHVGRLIKDFYRDDLSAAARLSLAEAGPGGSAPGFNEADEQFIQVFKQYEEHLPQQDMAVLQGLALVGAPLTVAEFTQVFAHAPFDHAAVEAASSQVSELQASFNALRARALLNAHTGSDGVPRYAAHSTISQYLSSARPGDAQGASLCAARYYESNLNVLRASSSDPGMSEAGGAGDAMRTRGAGVGPRGNPIAYPTSSAILDLMERIVIHTARGGRRSEARRFYLSRMGGDLHLKFIGHEGRMRRIHASLAEG